VYRAAAATRTSRRPSNGLVIENKRVRPEQPACTPVLGCQRL